MKDDYQSHIKNAMKKDGRDNNKREASHKLTHIILASAEEPEIKVMRLHTECGFGMMRAQELVYGSAKPKAPYVNKEVDKSLERFYHDSERP